MIAEYHVPDSVAEAVALRTRLGDRAVFLAGGTEVNSTACKLAAEHVISLERLPLTDIRLTATELVIGARCTLQQLLNATEVFPAVRSAAQHLTNRNIRNVATVGGQLAGTRSHGALRPTLVAVEAVVDLIRQDGPSTVDVLEYLEHHRDGLITQIRIPLTATARSVAVETYRRTANDRPILALAVSLTGGGAMIDRPIIAIDGTNDHVRRLREVEGALDGQPLPPRDHLERLVAAHVSPPADLAGSAEFKQHIAGVLVAKALMRAHQAGRSARS